MPRPSLNYLACWSFCIAAVQARPDVGWICLPANRQCVLALAKQPNASAFSWKSVTGTTEHTVLVAYCFQLVDPVEL